jgi:steroid delta-isomerase-like uncharacterized protein
MVGMETREGTMELLGRYYACFNAGDTDGMLGLMGAEVVHDINQGGSEVGLEAFRAFFVRMNRCYRESVSELQILVSDDGTRAAAEFIVHGTYLATDEGLPEACGQTYDLPAGAFFSVLHGKIQRVTMYYNLQDWLNQVNS